MEETTCIRFEEEELHDLDYTMEEAIQEARRCLHCANPLCRRGCPIANEIPQFTKAVAEGNFGEAADILARHTNMPEICGRICPRENQCEGACILGKKGNPIQIGKIERFIADLDKENHIRPVKKSTKKAGRVAVIGSGPAGLTVAHDLAGLDYDVTVYEEKGEPGGVLLYGIPSFRLKKSVVHRHIADLEAMGVQFVCQTKFGTDLTLEQVWEQGYDACFLGMGTNVSQTLRLENDGLPGIVDASALLWTVQGVQNGEWSAEEIPVQPGQTVLIIGAGNVAIDAARTCKRLGCKVTVVYRRGEANMKCLRSEYEEAKEEGIEFLFYHAPKGVTGTEKIEGLVCEIQEVLEDATMVPTGKMETIPADVIVPAVGNVPEAAVLDTVPGLSRNTWNYLETKELPYGMTSVPGVFAAGDLVHEPATVVLAMKEAKKAAAGIDEYIKAKRLMDAANA